LLSDYFGEFRHFPGGKLLGTLRIAHLLQATIGRYRRRALLAPGNYYTAKAVLIGHL
jgi:hypothetical protein